MQRKRMALFGIKLVWDIFCSCVVRGLTHKVKKNLYFVGAIMISAVSF